MVEKKSQSTILKINVKNKKIKIKYTKKERLHNRWGFEMAILSKLIGSIIFVVSQHLLQMAEQNDRLFEKKIQFQ